MRAAVCRAYGPPSVVAVADIAAPEPGPGQVRVRVEAAAVNFPDVLLVANRYQIPVGLPFVPGSEFAGTVDSTGPGSGAWSVGDRVFGTVMVGAFAERVVVAKSSVTSVPEGVTAAEAAAFGVAHRTAWHTLRSAAHILPGEDLIVLGAGGGVGLAAVQLGAEIGARVVAVASSQDKLDAARAAGAADVINHRAGDLRAALKAVVPDGASVVVDPVGGDLAEPALRSLRYGGRFVTVGFATGSIPRIPLNLVLLKGIAIVGFEFRSFATHQPETMRVNEAELLQLLASGAVRPHIGATFALEEIAEALDLVGTGRAVGKVVVEVGKGRPTGSR